MSAAKLAVTVDISMCAAEEHESSRLQAGLAGLALQQWNRMAQLSNPSQCTSAVTTQAWQWLGCTPAGYVPTQHRNQKASQHR